MKHNHSYISQTIQVGLLLALVGGFLEAYTFITRSGVFANCQTGNLVLLAMNLFKGNFSSILAYACPIIAFILGVFLTEKIKYIFGFHPRIHWRQIVIIFEIISLLVAVLVPEGTCDIAVTTLISFMCSMQTDSFRKVDGNPYATTMCTGNLRSASQSLFDYFNTGDKAYRKKSIRYFLVVLVFMCGAVVGVFLTNIFNTRAALFCCAILLIIFLMMFLHTPEEKEILRKNYIVKKINKTRKTRQDNR